MYVIVVTVLLTCVVDTSWSSETENAFVNYGLVPDVVSSPPKEALRVTYADDIVVDLGNELDISKLGGQPTLNWPYNPAKHYSLLMADADVPTRESPDARSHLLWLVVNIKGNNIILGETITIRVLPNILSKKHRIYYLVYEHDFVEFDEELSDSEERVSFSPDAFANRSKLGRPYAGNFFIAKFEENVTKGDD